MIKRLVLFLGAVMGMLCMSLPAQAHGTTADTITKKMLRETPPESYKIDMLRQKEVILLSTHLPNLETTGFLLQ